MTTQDLITQRDALDKQINEVIASERVSVLKTIRDTVKTYKFTERDVFNTRPAPARVGKPSSRKCVPVPAKYRDLITGKEWSGRGRTPEWLQGKNLADFAI